MASDGSFAKSIQRWVLSAVASRRGSTIVALLTVVSVLSLAKLLGDIAILSTGGRLAALRADTCITSSDNIAGRSFNDRLCNTPIDVVYTWVNGSDPIFLAEKERYRLAAGITIRGESSPGHLVGEEEGLGNGTAATFNGTNSSHTGGSDASGSGSDEGSEQDDQASNNRYRDNNELKYSLRSIEKYAPWVRRIFLVTNGQVPSWLDTEHPRLQVVTHEELFTNKSHLPVFSSPAIEVHLHKIPGLSTQFVYFNDDVFLGSDTWPDDFVTQSRGQKVYLSWDVPKCNPGCIETWIGDGFCDQACNVSSCDWDYPDCVNSTTGSGGTAAGGSTWEAPKYCSQGCPNNWIGDKTCDKRCNTKECGYDGTDCGDEVIRDGVLGADVSVEDIELTVPHDAHAYWVGVEGLAPSSEHTVVSASHTPAEGVRTAVLSDHFNMLTVLFDIEKHPSLATVAPNVAAAIAANGTAATDGGVAPAVQLDRFTVWVTFEFNETETKRQFHIKIMHTEAEADTNATDDDDGSGTTGADNDNSTDVHSGLFGSLASGRRLLSLHEVPTAPTLPVETAGSVAVRIVAHNPTPQRPLAHTRHALRAQRPRRRTQAPAARLVAGTPAWMAETQRRQAIATQRSLELQGAIRSAWIGAVRAAVASQGLGLHMSAQGELYSSGSGDDATSRPVLGSGRRLLDTYGDSLVYTNRLISREFARNPRKVPAHMPHFINVDVMSKLQERLPSEFDATSSHRFRDSADVQYAFAYFYFLIEGGAQQGLNMEEYWSRELDTDQDGVLSDNELRTLVAVVSAGEPTPELFEEIRACLKPSEGASAKPYAALDLLMNCQVATAGLAKHARFAPTHEENNLDEVAFEMITEDYNKTMEQLDSIRARKSKFVCVNDDMTNPSPELLQELENFYLSFFPAPSQFELPAGVENAHLYIGPLQAELSRRRWSRRIMYALGGVLLLVVLNSVWKTLRGPER